MKRDEYYDDVQFALRWLAEQEVPQDAPLKPPPAPPQGMFAALIGLIAPKQGKEKNGKR